MQSSFFNTLDYFYILLLLSSCLMGLFRGFTKDFLCSCSWLASGFVSATISPYITYYIQKNHLITSLGFSKFVSIFFSFLISSIVFSFFINRISSSIKASMFSGLDRALGTLYGFVKGFILIIIICIACQMFNVFNFKKDIIVNSKITPKILIIINKLVPHISNVSQLIPKQTKSRAQRLLEMNNLSSHRISNIQQSSYLQSNPEDSDFVASLKNFVKGFFNNNIYSFIKEKPRNRDSIYESFLKNQDKLKKNKRNRKR